MCDSSKILYSSTYCIYLSFPCHALWGTRDKRVYLTAWISNIKPLKCSFVPLGRKRTLGKAAGLQRFLWESIFNIPVVKCFQCVCPFRSAVPAETCHKETQHSDHFEWRFPGTAKMAHVSHFYQSPINLWNENVLTVLIIWNNRAAWLFWQATGTLSP